MVAAVVGEPLAPSRLRPGAAPGGAAPAVGLAVAAWAAVRAVQLAAGWAGYGNDVGEYLGYARLWAAGRSPYSDFAVEYPPGALPLFVLPWLLGGQRGFAAAFSAEMAAFDLGAALLVLGVARRLHPADRLRQARAVAAYLLATALLHPVLHARFDLAPAALAMAALYLADSSPVASPLLLGLGGAVKLWPLFLAPLWVSRARRRGGPRAAAQAALLVAGGLAAPLLLVLPRAGTSVAGIFRYHGARGLQVESTWATAVRLAQWAGLVDVRAVFEWGAWDLTCAGCSRLATASLPVMALLALAPQLRAARGGEPPGPDATARAAAAAVTGLLVGGKVLSPQFVLWICPLLAAVGGTASALALVATAALTSAVYPGRYQALLDPRAAGHVAAVGCLALRNALLLALYASGLPLWRRAGRPRTRRRADDLTGT